MLTIVSVLAALIVTLSGMALATMQRTARQYVDNGDGTITDTNSGLMWEKLSRDGSVHDYGTLYKWSDAFTKIEALNTAGFAGHADWRLPDIHELRALSTYGVLSPSIDAAFNTNCWAGCTILTCSCTQSFLHWSSSSSQGAVLAWHVGIGGIPFYALDKHTTLYVRAVRGP